MIEKSAKIEENVFLLFLLLIRIKLSLKQFGNSREHVRKFTISIIIALQTNRNPKL